jgi:hypothetical protein
MGAVQDEGLLAARALQAAVTAAIGAAHPTCGRLHLSIACRHEPIASLEMTAGDFDAVTTALAGLLREAASQAKPHSALNIKTRQHASQVLIEVSTVLRQSQVEYQAGLESAIARTVCQAMGGEVRIDLIPPRRLRTTVSMPTRIA